MNNMFYYRCVVKQNTVRNRCETNAQPRTAWCTIKRETTTIRSVFLLPLSLIFSKDKSVLLCGYGAWSITAPFLLAKMPPRDDKYYTRERHSNRASGSTLHFRQTATTASNAGGWFRALRPEVSRELGNVVGTG